MNYQNKLQKEILNNNLCSGCGTCAGVCPKDCIQFEQNGYTPKFETKKCVDCGLCYKVCPSTGFLFCNFKNDATSWHDQIGPYVSFANVWSTDKQLRKSGASGGTVATILKYVLEKKIVDKIVCVKKDKEDFSVYITDDYKVLSETQGSKYIPIPVNTAIKDILKNKWHVAVVGTPCHLQGIEKASIALPLLKECIKYRIGIFCGFAQPQSAFLALRNYLNAQDSSWEFIGWRCDEYPGYVKFVNSKTKEVKKLLIYDALNIVVPFYSMEKCFMCPDGLNISSDFSFGDIHSRGKDKNCAIIRTVTGKELIENMIQDKYLEIENISLDAAMKSTVGSVAYLKGMRSLLYIKTNKNPIPKYDISFDKNNYNRFVVIQNRIQLSLYRFVRKRRILYFLEKHPKLQMSIGRYIYIFPNYSLIYKALKVIVSFIKRK